MKGMTVPSISLDVFIQPSSGYPSLPGATPLCLLRIADDNEGGGEEGAGGEEDDFSAASPEVGFLRWELRGPVLD